MCATQRKQRAPRSLSQFSLAGPGIKQTLRGIPSEKASAVPPHAPNEEEEEEGGLYCRSATKPQNNTTRLRTKGRKKQNTL
jgi:hypothetical protein